MTLLSGMVSMLSVTKFCNFVPIVRSSPMSQKEALLDLMWNVWSDLPTYGCKAAQFVDLLGYFTIKTPQSSERKVHRHLVSS